MDYDMRIHRKDWTDEEKQQLRTLLQTGNSRPEIAKQLNRRPAEIRAMVGELRSLEVAAAAAAAAAKARARARAADLAGEAVALDADKGEEDGGDVLPATSKGRQGSDQKFSETAVRAASGAFSAAIEEMAQRRRAQVGPE